MIARKMTITSEGKTTILSRRGVKLPRAHAIRQPRSLLSLRGLARVRPDIGPALAQQRRAGEVGHPELTCLDRKHPWLDCSSKGCLLMLSHGRPRMKGLTLEQSTLTKPRVCMMKRSESLRADSRCRGTDTRYLFAPNTSASKAVSYAWTLLRSARHTAESFQALPMSPASTCPSSTGRAADNSGHVSTSTSSAAHSVRT